MHLLAGPEHVGPEHAEEATGRKSDHPLNRCRCCWPDRPGQIDRSTSKWKRVGLRSSQETKAPNRRSHGEVTRWTRWTRWNLGGGAACPWTRCARSLLGNLSTERTRRVLAKVSDSFGSCNLKWVVALGSTEAVQRALFGAAETTLLNQREYLLDMGEWPSAMAPGCG